MSRTIPITNNSGTEVGQVSVHPHSDPYVTITDYYGEKVEISKSNISQLIDALIIYQRERTHERINHNNGEGNIDAQGNHVNITGPNESGKTSTVDAIWLALGGKSARKLDQPIKDGEKNASVKLDLGKYVVERKWTEKATTLVVKTGEGHTVSKPQAILDGLLSEYCLDPLAFLNLAPREQALDVLRLANIGMPIEEVKEIVGTAVNPNAIETNAIDYLGGIEKRFYDQRTDINRTLATKRSAHSEAAAQLFTLGGATDEPIVSASELTGAIEALREQADKRKAVVDKLDDATEDEAKAQKEVGRLKAAHLKAVEEYAKWNPVILTLEEQRDAIPDPAAEIEAKKTDLGNLETKNEGIRERQQQATTAATLEADKIAAEAKHSNLDTIVEKLRSLKTSLAASIDIVPGLTIGDDGLLFEGVPFSQASRSRRLRVALAIATAQNPELKLLRIDDGEHLDGKAKAEVSKYANEKGYQVIMTCVADQDDLKVEIVEANYESE